MDNMAIAALIISLLVACAVIYREFLHDRIFKPDLQIEFRLDKPISRMTIVKWPPGAMTEKSAFWPRLRIVNKGRSVARRCEAVLVEVRRPDGSPDDRYDPLTLRWAIAPEISGLEPLDIARGRQVDLNTFTTIENERFAPFATHQDPRGIPLGLGPGDYWIRITIYGNNFNPVSRGYAIHWDGKDYKRVAMKKMNNVPTSTTTWPWQIEQRK